MSNSLKSIFLFIGLKLTVKEVCYEQNLDMNSDLSLDDLKNQKKNKSFIKKNKELSNRFRFFDSEIPYESRTSFLSPFLYWEHKIGSFCLKVNFDILFFIEVHFV